MNKAILYAILCAGTACGATPAPSAPLAPSAPRMPYIQMPYIQMPYIQVPSIQVPSIRMPAIDQEGGSMMQKGHPFSSSSRFLSSASNALMNNTDPFKVPYTSPKSSQYGGTQNSGSLKGKKGKGRNCCYKSNCIDLTCEHSDDYRCPFYGCKGQLDLKCGTTCGTSQSSPTTCCANYNPSSHQMESYCCPVA